MSAMDVSSRFAAAAFEAPAMSKTPRSGGATGAPSSEGESVSGGPSEFAGRLSDLSRQENEASEAARRAHAASPPMSAMAGQDAPRKASPDRSAGERALPALWPSGALAAHRAIDGAQGIGTAPDAPTPASAGDKPPSEGALSPNGNPAVPGLGGKVPHGRNERPWGQRPSGFAPFALRETTGGMAAPAGLGGAGSPLRPAGRAVPFAPAHPADLTGSDSVPETPLAGSPLSFVPAASPPAMGEGGVATDSAVLPSAAPHPGEPIAAGGASRESGQPHAAIAAPFDWGSGLENRQLAQMKVAAVGQQSHFGFVQLSSPTRQMSGSGLASDSALASETARTFEHPVSLAPQKGDGDNRGDAAPQGRAEYRAGPRPYPNAGRAPAVLASAPMAARLHPASGAALPPAQQIVAFVAASAVAATEGATGIAAQAGEPNGPASAAAPSSSTPKVQTMQLQLEPENLGLVTIRMRLSGARLELRVEAEQPETARLIGKEKDLLGGKLQSAGYALDSLIIQQAELRTADPKLGAYSLPAAQDQPMGQANGGQNDHDRPAPRGGGQSSRPAPADETQDGGGDRFAGGSLFL